MSLIRDILIFIVSCLVLAGGFAWWIYFIDFALLHRERIKTPKNKEQ